MGGVNAQPTIPLPEQTEAVVPPEADSATPSPSPSPSPIVFTVTNTPQPITTEMPAMGPLMFPAQDEVIDTRYPLFVWSAHPDAIAYKLIVKRKGAKTPRLNKRLDAAQICGDGLCAVDSALFVDAENVRLGNNKTYRWWVTAITLDERQTSQKLFFKVSTMPTPVLLPTETPYGRPPDGYESLGQSGRISLLPTIQVTANSANVVRTAIAASNANCNNNYVIVLQSGKFYTISNAAAMSPTQIHLYGSSAFQPINCSVTIKGQNAVLARSTGTAVPPFRLFTVAQNGYLRLEDVTLQDGRANDRGGGAVFNDRGYLEVYRSTIKDNRVNKSTTFQFLGGGIYSYYGGLQVIESVITGNRAVTQNSDGGGIGVINRKPDQNTIITGNDIRSNRALRKGNGVYIQDQFPSVQVHDNCFVGNYHPNPQPQTSNISVQTGNSTAIDGEYNWWGSSSGPLVNQSANANRDSVDSLVGHVPYKTAEPTPCNRIPTLTPTTPSNPIDTIIQELATYGITAYSSGVGPGRTNGQAWTLTELEEVQQAVQDTARAFNLRWYNENSGDSSQAKTLFRNVMKQVQSGANLEILRVNNNFQFGGGDPCDGTQDAGCTSNGNTAIALYGVFYLNGNLTNANYTVVHELGHRFDNQSATNGVQGLRLRMDGPSVITDCNGNRVMGTYFDDPNPNDWKRGARGWGTPGLSDFQQNVLEIIDSSSNNSIDETLELSEAAADMFLNWVYRRLTDAAASGDPCTTRTEIGSWLGFRNIDGSGNLDPASAYSGNRRFWWIEDQIQQIFTLQTTWR